MPAVEPRYLLLRNCKLRALNWAPVEVIEVERGEAGNEASKDNMPFR